VLDLLTNTPHEAWFYSRVMAPGFSSIMPQAVGAWAEELGHQVFYEAFTGREDLLTSLPDDLDVLFISCFSRASFLAYGISSAYRRRGCVTVMGGPHARSYGSHARRYFDYVARFTDKDLVRSLLQGPSRQELGVVLDAGAQPGELPGIRQRARFIAHALAKGTSMFQAVPVIGSLGCPYSCTFCVDAPVAYRTMPFEGLVDDLRFTQERFGPNAMVGWHDPNFGVRFKDYIRLIDESGTRLRHIAESSLSLLGEENLKALQRTGFVAMLPGIESWNDFNAKGGAAKLDPTRKLHAVAEHLNQIASYLPYVQANFVLGLDCDAGSEPWELTKQFVDLAPGVLPAYSMVTDFANSPLSAELKASGRTLRVPYPLLDNNFTINVKLKNYDPLEFYDRMIDLEAHTWSARATARRLRANERWVAKLLNLGRALTEGRGRLAHHRAIRARLASDSSFYRFACGEDVLPPAFYFEAIGRQLGRYREFTPPELLSPASFVATVEEASALEASERGVSQRVGT
jgi:hypothetical protein